MPKGVYTRTPAMKAKMRGTFQKGQTPWNKDTVGLMPEPWNKNTNIQTNTGRTHFKRGRIPSNKKEWSVLECRCGNEFVATYWNKKYCSNHCAHIYRELTEEHKAKIGATHRGMKHASTGPAWNKGLKGFMAGEKHPNWKGGSKHGERVRFRDQMQMIIFKRDNFTCQICDQSGGYLQVDHIKRWSEYPELRFEESNCRTLCMACHYYITFKRKLPDGMLWGHGLSRRIS